MRNPRLCVRVPCGIVFDSMKHRRRRVAGNWHCPLSESRLQVIKHVECLALAFLLLQLRRHVKVVSQRLKHVLDTIKPAVRLWCSMHKGNTQCQHTSRVLGIQCAAIHFVVDYTGYYLRFVSAEGLHEVISSHILGQTLRK